MIQSFAYRNPRIAASFPVEFQTEHGVLLGATRDISEHGLLVDFGEPVLLNTTGRVRFRMLRWLLEIEAEVTHSQGFTSGLVFAFSSEREGSLIRAILQAFTTAAEHPEA